MLTALLGAALSAATFFIGRQTSAKASGQEWGEMKTDIRYIKDNVREIKAGMADGFEELRQDVDKEKGERREAVRQMHERVARLEKEWNHV